MGTVKAKCIKRTTGTITYQVTLVKGTLEDLKAKLGGDITNLVIFCDNGFNFDDKVDRSYGGNVRQGWIYYSKVLGKDYENFCYSTQKPSADAKIAFIVEVYTD